ncbi:MAG: GTPase Era [Thermoleophilia bacterium]
METPATGFEAAPPGFRSGYAAVVGRPNVGKSTLVNRMLDHKVSITSDRPQTTRHRISGVLTTDAYQLILLDIPGFQKPRDLLTERMQGRVEETLSEVDVVLFLLAADQAIGRGDSYIGAYLAKTATPVVVALNKVDLADAKTLSRRRAEIDRMEGRHSFCEILEISALLNYRVAELRESLASRLPEGPLYFPPGTVTDQPEDLLIAELIREKAIRLTEDEVPHSLAVQVLEAEPRKEGRLLYLRAVIYVERDSQRPILLGEGGARIKQIGTEARQEIETLFGTQVFLDLGVKVRKRWRRDQSMLDRLGL